MLDRLLLQLRAVAPDSVDVPLLQPADPFLEIAGEDLRRRIFITETADGAIQCLRPEFTIPICLAHSGKLPARYAYGGTVFRQMRDGSSEFLQAGLEDLGRPDILAADAACIADLLASLSAVGIDNSSLILGDQNLFGVVVANLELPEAIARRLMRNFGSPLQIEELINRLGKSGALQNGESAGDKLARAGDIDGLVRHVEERMDNANLSPLSGRSPQDIAARMIDKAEEGRFRLDSESAGILRRFLSLQVSMEDAVSALENFSVKTGIEFGEAGQDFSGRADLLDQSGLDLSRITYQASFGRNLEYYTGVLFEARVGETVVAGGGRYDRLCTLLGAEKPVPAVGFSIWLDRVEDVL